MASEGGPIRGAAELAQALRARAGLLGGQGWEVPATVAMMREAADRIERDARAVRELVRVIDAAIALLAEPPAELEKR